MEGTKAHHTEWMSETPDEIQYHFEEIIYDHVGPAYVKLLRNKFHPQEKSESNQ